MKIVNTEEENLYLQNDLRIFNEIFRKDVTYDNIKSHRKTRFHPLFGRYIFGKTSSGSNWPTLTPPRLSVVNEC